MQIPACLKPILHPNTSPFVRKLCLDQRFLVCRIQMQEKEPDTGFLGKRKNPPYRFALCSCVCQVPKQLLLSLWSLQTLFFDIMRRKVLSWPDAVLHAPLIQSFSLIAFTMFNCICKEEIKALKQRKLEANFIGNIDQLNPLFSLNQLTVPYALPWTHKTSSS